jgi:uncharacterized protein (TIGR03067 family)
MRCLLLLGVLAVAVPDRPDPNPPQGKPITEAIQGDWEVVASTWKGGEAYPYITPGAVFIFKGESMTLHLRSVGDPKPGAGGGYHYAFALDGKKTPVTIDFSIGGKLDRKVALPGIVKLDGDMLTICYQFGAPTTRPTAFATSPESRLVMWQMKRAKR